MKSYDDVWHLAERLNSIQGLADLAFSQLAKLVPSRLYLLALKSRESKLTGFYSEHSFKRFAQAYHGVDRETNPWVELTPFSSSTKVIRYSKYTGQDDLLASAFYRRILRPAGIQYGAAVTIWKGNVWLATVTLLRTRKEGDFTNSELALLQHWQKKVSPFVVSLAKHHERRFSQRVLEKFLWIVPLALVQVDWNLRIRYHNLAAKQCCHWWNHGAIAPVVKYSNKLKLPQEIMRSLRECKTRILLSGAGFHAPSLKKTVICKDCPDQLTATISYHASESLTISRGLFHIQLHQSSMGNVIGDAVEHLSLLTHRERECFHHLLRGKGTSEIARILRKSRNTVRNQLSVIYQKLGVSGHTKLLALYAQRCGIMLPRA